MTHKPNWTLGVLYKDVLLRGLKARVVRKKYYEDGHVTVEIETYQEKGWWPLKRTLRFNYFVLSSHGEYYLRLEVI